MLALALVITVGKPSLVAFQLHRKDTYYSKLHAQHIATILPVGPLTINTEHLWPLHSQLHLTIRELIRQFLLAQKSQRSYLQIINALKLIQRWYSLARACKNVPYQIAQHEVVSDAIQVDI